MINPIVGSLLFTASFIVSLLYFVLNDSQRPHWVRRRYWPGKTLLMTRRWKVRTHGGNLVTEKRPGALPWHGRVWLELERRFPGRTAEKEGVLVPNEEEFVNTMHWEWLLFPRQFKAGIEFQLSDTGDDDFQINLYLPFLIALYFMIKRWPAVKRLPGVRWQPGDYNSGYREIGFRLMSDGLWIYPWIHYDGQWIHIDPAKILFGSRSYSQSPRERHEVSLDMPEGSYPAVVELYEARWKRPRWPVVKRIRYADVVVQQGIPFPGKGDNGWDMDDDATYEMTGPAATVEEALAMLRESVMRDRERYGGKEWRPPLRR